MPVLLMSATTESTNVERSFLKVIPKRLAFIPAKTDSQRHYFHRICDHFYALGVQEIIYCDLDSEYRPAVWEKIESCEVIYLGGGHTPHFLHTLQKRNALVQIKKLNETKSIIGVSAGALVLGLDVSILSDDPAEGYFTKPISDPRGVGLYDFDFWPHYGKHDSDERRLCRRSEERVKVILSCDDYSGIIVNTEGVEVVGEAHLFKGGKAEVLKAGIYAKKNLSV